MKTVTLNNRITKNLTEAIAVLSKSDLFKSESYQAKNGSGDTVYVLTSKDKINFIEVKFCVKDSKFEVGKKYVNWAKVYGTEEIVDDFLTKVEYVPRDEVQKGDLSQLFG